MAAVGPYGIDQVDVPGVLGAYQGMQGNRIKMMMEQKQLEMMDRQMAIQGSMAKAAQGWMASMGGNASASPSGATSGPSSASSASTPPSGPSPAQVSSAMATASNVPSVGPMTAANAAGQPAPVPSNPASSGTMGSSLNLPPQSYTSGATPMLGMMGFLAPEQGQAMANVFSKMDDAQLGQWKARNQATVQEFAGLLQLPYAQRQAAIQQNAADLQRLGYTPQQIAGFDPSDGNVRMEIAKHTEADHIADMVNPHFENMRAGGAVSQTQPYGDSSIVAQSPEIQGPHGAVYGTPQALNGLPTVQTPQDAAKLPPGTKFKLPDGRIGVVPGGAGGNASGGFQ